ncbi:MAG TPA: DUF692 domain-containing protein [Polyangiaceae bacterium]|nr:DUF692 domain-containing protein [Polyangiaceae bacterium]
MTKDREENAEPRRAGARSGSRPQLGFGVGLRAQHFRHVLERPIQVDWFEIISENFMDSQGWPSEVLRRLTRRFPVVPHGVSLSIGSADPLDGAYLERLRRLADACAAPWVSDHLCWTTVGGHNSHDLLPLPYTEQTLEHIAARIALVQERLGRHLLLENPSSYLSFSESTLSEGEFLAELCERADCGILLDVNNLYVCQRNHGWDPRRYLAALPPERIWQIHIAGHTDHGSHCIDTHSGPVAAPVWELYLAAIQHCGEVSTLLEWDQDIPDFEVLEQQLALARQICATGALPEQLAHVPNAAGVERGAVSNPISFLIEPSVLSP